MENINEFNKAWKKTCPICITNPNSILWFKNQCNDCNIKEKSNKKYTEEDMLHCWNTLMVAMTHNNPIFFKDYINSLNKQD